ncbi:hypothetical protein KR044_012092, partial [Drosophila immigrans]
KRIFMIIKITIFVIVWSFFAILFILKAPHEPKILYIALQPNESYNVALDEQPTGNFVGISLKGNIDGGKTSSPSTASSTDPFVAVTLESINSDTNETLWQSSSWNVYLIEDHLYITSTVKTLIELNDWKSKKALERSQRMPSDSDTRMQVSLLNMDSESTGVSMIVNPNPIDPRTGSCCGAVLVLFLYFLIAFEITDRTFAAILVSATAIGILCLMDVRPSFPKILSWIDIDTLMLLFGMMVMVGILSDTGLFDYLSLFAYRLSQGKIWLLLFYLYMFTGILSALLDNVTMVLMIVPVTVRLCEAVGLNTILVVINIVIFSNVGGALTPVGDPPNMILATNKDVVNSGVQFGNFTLHMFPGVVLSMMIVYLVVYFTTRDTIYTGRASQLRQSIEALERLARTMKEKEKEEALKRLSELRERLKGHETNATTANMDFDSNLNDMRRKYKIRDKVLLIKCIISFTFAVALFLLHAVPSLHGISLAWAAVLAALLLLILADRPDVDKLLERVEWSTLIFFAALFVLTEALVEIGLIDRVSTLTINLIMTVGKEWRLVVSILLVLWISALGASLVGNIPITTMMLKLTISLAKDEKLKLPMQPLIWAIAFGACFGGNGTLIGASANVVSAGIASQYGHNINFVRFFIVGFPIMMLTVTIASIYLLIVHCWFTWH